MADLFTYCPWCGAALSETKACASCQVAWFGRKPTSLVPGRTPSPPPRRSRGGRPPSAPASTVLTSPAPVVSIPVQSSPVVTAPPVPSPSPAPVMSTPSGAALGREVAPSPPSSVPFPASSASAAPPSSEKPPSPVTPPSTRAGPPPSPASSSSASGGGVMVIRSLGNLGNMNELHECPMCGAHLPPSRLCGDCGIQWGEPPRTEP